MPQSSSNSANNRRHELLVAALSGGLISVALTVLGGIIVKIGGFFQSGAVISLLGGDLTIDSSGIRNWTGSGEIQVTAKCQEDRIAIGGWCHLPTSNRRMSVKLMVANGSSFSC